MHGRKQHLLNSVKMIDEAAYQQTAANSRSGSGNGAPLPVDHQSSPPPLHGTASSGGGDSITSLNLNQPLTDQLTQRGRQQHLMPPSSSAGSGSSSLRDREIVGVPSPAVAHGASGNISRTHSDIEMVSYDLVPQLSSRGSGLGRSPFQPSSNAVSPPSSSSLPPSSSSTLAVSQSKQQRTFLSGSESVSSGNGSGPHRGPPLLTQSSSSSSSRAQLQLRNHSPPAGLVGGGVLGGPSHLGPPGPGGSGSGQGPNGISIPPYRPELDPAAVSRLMLHHQAQALRLPLPSALLSPYLLQPDSAVTRQLEQLWQTKYPQRDLPPAWMLHQFQEELYRQSANLAAAAAAAVGAGPPELPSLPMTSSSSSSSLASSVQDLSRDREHRSERAERERERDRERDRDREREYKYDQDRIGRHIDCDQNDGQHPISVRDRHFERESSKRSSAVSASDRIGLLHDQRQGPNSWDPGPPPSRHTPGPPGGGVVDRRPPATERSLIVEQTATVDQHFSESLLRLVGQKLPPSFAALGPGGPNAPLPPPWNPLSLAVNNSSSSSSPAGPTSAFAPLPPGSFKKSPAEQISTSQSSAVAALRAGKSVHREHSPSSHMQQQQAAMSMMPSSQLQAHMPFQRFADEIRNSAEMEERMKRERMRSDEKARCESKIKLEESGMFSDVGKFGIGAYTKAEMKMKYEDSMKYEKPEMNERSGMRSKERFMIEERLRYDEQKIKNELESVKPRPAHTGAVAGGNSGGGGDGNKSRNTGGGSSSSNRSAPAAAFSLYGYQPNMAAYVSADKVNHAINGDHRPLEKSGSSTNGPRYSAAAVDMSMDSNSAKQTSVIVEHRRPPPSHVVPEPSYRNRGSITQGTSGDSSLIRSGSNWFDGGVPPPRSEANERSGWGVQQQLQQQQQQSRSGSSGKQRPVVSSNSSNGLCWSSSQGLTLSPSSKSDLPAPQGLIPNSTFIHAVDGHSGSSQISGRLMDEQSMKRLTAPSTQRDQSQPSMNISKGVSQSSLMQQAAAAAAAAAATGIPGIQASYIDSFKSFVDRAVQSAFMEDANPDHAHHLSVNYVSGDGGVTMESSAPTGTTSGTLHSLSASPIAAANSRTMTCHSPASSLPLVARPNPNVVDNAPVSGSKIVASLASVGSGVCSPFSVASLTKTPSSGSFGSATRPSSATPSSLMQSDAPMLASVQATISCVNQMPVLVSSAACTASVQQASSSPIPSSSSTIFNSDPPLLVPQRPISARLQDGPGLAGSDGCGSTRSAPSGDRRSAASESNGSAVKSRTAHTAAAVGGSGDTDSDTLSAHSPAPLLVPMTGTPPPSISASSGGGGGGYHNYKKSWLMRYSDEDRKTTGPPSGDRRGDVSEENPVDQPDLVNGKWNGGGPTKTSRARSCNGSSTEQSSDADTVESKFVLNDKNDLDTTNDDSNVKDTAGTCVPDDADEEDKSNPDVDSVRTCYVNCGSYVSAAAAAKDYDGKSPRKAVSLSKDDKEGESAMDVESDSQSAGVQCRSGKRPRRTKKPSSSEATPPKKLKTSPSTRDSSDGDSSSHITSAASNSSGSPAPVKVNSNKSSQSSSSSTGHKVHKTAAPSTTPQSDCEKKVAARIKEMKGKPRSGTLSSVLENKPLNKFTSEARRKKTREPFVQDGPCAEVTPKLMKCRECKMSNGQRNNSQLANNIFCRFYAFRKLCYNAKGVIAVSGFCKPPDADADDIELWLPVANSDRRFTIDKAKYVISVLSESFIKLLEDEKQALELGKAHASKVAWKRAILGVSEMCDSCDKTLFNVHWTCAKCGFAVCVDCYRTKRSSCSDDDDDDDDEDNDDEGPEWLTCSSNKQPHDVNSLMMTQIIPSDVLSAASRMLTDVMSKWNIRSCSSSRTSVENGSAVLNHINGIRTSKYARSRKMRSLKEDSDSTGSATPSLDSSSNDTSRIKENCSLLAESKCNGYDFDGSDDQSLDSLDKLSDVIHPSSNLLDNGRLLRLTGNDLVSFQQHWQKSLPVIVSRLDTWYRADIWRPSALARCGGCPVTDLHTGAEIPASRYWDQFDHSPGKYPSVVTQPTVSPKDWPTPDDLSAFSTHLRDLDAGLPLLDYTRLGGTMHAISHLPEYFVRPELCSLRVHGHGFSVSGQVTPCSKLRVDSADTVNAAVYTNGDQEYDLNNPGLCKALGDSAQMAKLIQSCSKRASKPVSAVWHVFRPQDLQTIRSFQQKVASNGKHETVSDVNSYLDAAMRSRLANEHSVHCSTVVQCVGDTVFVPAMAPYQICAIHNSIIASREFLSPESLRYCHNAGIHRHSSGSLSTNSFEDQMQGKNLIYHTVKDAIAVLRSADP